MAVIAVANTIKDILELVNDENYFAYTIFISFDFENLVHIKEMYPNASIQYLCYEYSDELAEDLLKNGFDLDINYTALSKEIVNNLKANGIKVNCWTVNNLNDANRLIEYGVNYITTNILE